MVRAWERRYALVDPLRTESGYRLYSDEDVSILRAAARLVAHGHSIGDVARLPRDELRSTAERVEDVIAAAPPAPPPSKAIGPDNPFAPALREAIEAARNFDRDSFEAALFAPLVLQGLQPRAACEQVLLPLLRAIGDGWEKGTISVAAEHFASSLIRSKIVQMLQSFPRSGGRRRVVAACPEGEAHEGGLLAFSVHAAADGWEVVYLGAPTPVGEALATVTRTSARGLGLSLTMADAAAVATLGEEIADFRRRHPDPFVVAGGRSALQHRGILEAAGVVVAERLVVDLSKLNKSSPP